MAFLFVFLICLYFKVVKQKVLFQILSTDGLIE